MLSHIDLSRRYLAHEIPLMVDKQPELHILSSCGLVEGGADPGRIIATVQLVDSAFVDGCQLVGVTECEGLRKRWRGKSRVT